MQDKDLLQNRDRENVERAENEAPKTAEDGVVYVQNEDGTSFDASERTYVAVEGLEGEVGSDNEPTDTGA